MTMLSFLCALGGFALLGLSTDLHHRSWFGHRCPATQRRRMRVAAWALLAGSFVPATVAAGWIFGPVLWVGIVMAGAGAAFLAINLLKQA